MRQNQKNYSIISIYSNRVACWSSAHAALSCTSCGKGKYNNAEGKSALSDCTDCGGGKYNDDVASDEEADCKSCDAGNRMSLISTNKIEQRS